MFIIILYSIQTKIATRIKNKAKINFQQQVLCLKRKNAQKENIKEIKTYKSKFDKKVDRTEILVSQKTGKKGGKYELLCRRI